MKTPTKRQPKAARREVRRPRTLQIPGTFTVSAEVDTVDQTTYVGLGTTWLTPREAKTLARWLTQFTTWSATRHKSPRRK